MLTHRTGYTHYETDMGDESCPDYHWERVPCPLCGAGTRFVDLRRERE